MRYAYESLLREQLKLLEQKSLLPLDLLVLALVIRLLLPQLSLTAGELISQHRDLLLEPSLHLLHLLH